MVRSRVFPKLPHTILTGEPKCTSVSYVYEKKDACRREMRNGRVNPQPDQNAPFPSGRITLIAGSETVAYV